MPPPENNTGLRVEAASEEGNAPHASRPFARACRAQMRDRAAVLRAAGIAVVVGTILTLVNQGDRIVSGETSLGLWVRVGVTYLVPFVVANLGAIGARMSFAATGDGRGDT